MPNQVYASHRSGIAIRRDIPRIANADRGRLGASPKIATVASVRHGAGSAVASTKRCQM